LKLEKLELPEIRRAIHREWQEECPWQSLHEGKAFSRRRKQTSLINRSPKMKADGGSRNEPSVYLLPAIFRYGILCKRATKTPGTDAEKDAANDAAAS